MIERFLGELEPDGDRLGVAVGLALDWPEGDASGRDGDWDALGEEWDLRMRDLEPWPGIIRPCLSDTCNPVRRSFIFSVRPAHLLLCVALAFGWSVRIAPQSLQASMRPEGKSVS